MSGLIGAIKQLGKVFGVILGIVVWIEAGAAVGRWMVGGVDMDGPRTLVWLFMWFGFHSEPCSRLTGGVTTTSG